MPRTIPGGHAAGVVHPRTEAEVAAVLRAYDRVLPIGAQSSVTGGATPSGDLVLSTSKMTAVLEVTTGSLACSRAWRSSR